MTSTALAEWYAFYQMTDSAQNPKPTEWDAPEMWQAKLDREAQRKLKK